MTEAHAGVAKSGPGSAIAYADFTRYLDHVAAALASTGLSEDDRNAVIEAFEATCEAIVPGGAGCP